ncbi:Uncharacterised protein [Mycobacteroides abscessus subsp. abscessus]|nr:Uncharacterised protein [Mycobacteroides abscessus subsp. abscessus]
MAPKPPIHCSVSITIGGAPVSSAMALQISSLRDSSSATAFCSTA